MGRVWWMGLWMVFWWGAEAVAGSTPRSPALVASDHPVASQCGATILDRGGNAVDAVVAATLCAGVVQPAGSGLGGGGFAVVRTVDGVMEVFDFRETAPSAAHRDMYLDEGGEPLPRASKDGGLAVAVPAESRGLAALLSAHGRLRPSQVARPAIRLARRGFVVEGHLARSLARVGPPEIVGELGVDGGRLPEEGERLRRPELGRTLARWAATQGEDLHTGRSARAIASHVQADGGVLSERDLADYEVVRRAPLVTSFQGYTIVGLGLPSSGGLLLAQMLRVLEAAEVGSMERGSAAYLHRLSETMAHAYADRVALGDPEAVTLDVETLVSDDRIGEILARFDQDRTFPPEYYSEAAPPTDNEGTHHLAAVDAAGMAVGLTTTINTTFGAKLVAPGTGVILNNEMNDFTTHPDHPNWFGLIQGEANMIRPGLRPLSSMTPTLVLDDRGEPVMVVGGSGGSTIITATLQVLLDVLVFGMDPDEAVAAPRIHHQWRPDRLWVEPRLSPDTQALLRARGHEIMVRPAFSAVQVLVRDEDGRWTGAADPRKGGAVAAPGR